MIHNQYQEILAERSLVIHAAEDGEGWEFYWYIDPITNGLSKLRRFFAHVSFEGQVDMLGMWTATSDEDRIAQQQAIQFVKDRYKRFGLNEEDTEGGD